MGLLGDWPWSEIHTAYACLGGSVFAVCFYAFGVFLCFSSVVFRHCIFVENAWKRTRGVTWGRHLRPLPCCARRGFGSAPRGRVVAISLYSLNAFIEDESVSH